MQTVIVIKEVSTLRNWAALEQERRHLEGGTANLRSHLVKM